MKDWTMQKTNAKKKKFFSGWEKDILSLYSPQALQIRWSILQLLIIEQYSDTLSHCRDMHNHAEDTCTLKITYSH